MANNDFGSNVVATREALGMNRSELQRVLEAQGTPMHMTTLRRIEGGEQEPKLSEAKAISDALGLTVEQLSMSPEMADKLRTVWTTAATHKRITDQLLSNLLEWSIATDNALVAVRDAARDGVPLSELRETLDRIDQYSELDTLDHFLSKAQEGRETEPVDSRDVYREFQRIATGADNAEG
ncbi:helix-turn-helix transcriptional regulator [Corynebacterium lehmanniae]|nr:helix-turn-helix transcriptional regulator [Corynebacterium lehmanniae]